MNRVAWIPPVIFAVSIPLFLVTASVAWAFNDAAVYQRGFERYQVVNTSGISPADLRQVAADLRGYFNSTKEPLLVKTRVFGEEREIFSQREVRHMRDVKRLVWWVYAIAALSGLYLLAATVWDAVSGGRRFVTTLAYRVMRGAGLTLVLVVAFGLLALAGFDALFLKFHQLSFSNDLWQLDPRRDYLVILFPQGFWFDATMRVAATTVAAAVALLLISGGYLLQRRGLGRKRPKGPIGNLEEATEG